MAARNGDSLELESMLPGLDDNESQTQTENGDSSEFYGKPLSDAKKGFERAYLEHLLESTRGNISEMARISGRYRADIYRLLSKYGVEWEEFRT